MNRAQPSPELAAELRALRDEVGGIQWRAQGMADAIGERLRLVSHALDLALEQAVTAYRQEQADTLARLEIGLLRELLAAFPIARRCPECGATFVLSPRAVQSGQLPGCPECGA